MLIFVVTPLFPNPHNKQHGIYVFEQCKALVKQGNRVVVLNISPLRWNRWFEKTCSEIEMHDEEGMDIYTLNPRGILSSKLPRYSIFSAWRNLKKLYKAAELKHGKPDVFHSHFTFTAGYVTNKLSQKTNIPFIVTEHYSLFLKSRIDRYIIKILNETIDNASEFICVSSSLKTALEKCTFTQKKISIIPNLVDDRFEYYDYVNSGDDKFIFFSAGNLTASKSFDLLIESFCLAFDEKEDIYLRIAGDGREYGKLMNLVIKNNRQGQITLLGRLNREEILKQYVECNCFVLPSKYETFGIVYREAMAVGRPVISTQNGGIEEGWEDSFGILIPIDNQPSLTSALVNMYTQMDNYDLEYISEKCLEKYSVNAVSSNIANILKSVVAKA